MDFSLSEDQRQMQDEMAKSLERISSLQRVRELAQAGASLELPRDIWAQLCELGIPGILIEQRHQAIWREFISTPYNFLISRVHSFSSGLSLPSQ